MLYRDDMKSLNPRITTINKKRVGSDTPRSTKPTLSFYKTREWTQLVAEIIRERGRHCENIECAREGILTRIFADHIIEIKDGGALLDKKNIKLLCGSCHTTKTLQ